MSVWDELYEVRAKQREEAAIEKAAKAVEDGCPTKAATKRPCFACQQAAERVRKCA
ncbi:MAG: hypothetical protein V4510_12400 [bacterium]